jgi:hypothetical protein
MFGMLRSADSYLGTTVLAIFIAPLTPHRRAHSQLSLITAALLYYNF